MADVVGAGDLADGLAGVAPAQGFLALVQGQLRLAAHPNTAGLRPFSSFSGPGPDQLPFEFRQAAEDGEHQPAVRRCGVGPAVTEGAEPGTLLGDGRQRVEQVPG